MHLKQKEETLPANNLPQEEEKYHSNKK